MPNWVYNTLIPNDENGRKFILDNCLDDQGKFTFNKLVPMPEILEHTVAPTRIAATTEEFEAFRKKYGENVNCTFEHLGMLYAQSSQPPMRNCIITQECWQFLVGHYEASDWYGWRYNNWGCKWDASGDPCDKDTDWDFHFDTPWGHPDVFVATFAQKAYEACPESIFSWEWEEEQGFGAVLEIAGGEVSETLSWDIPSCDSYDLKIHFSNGSTEDITVYHYLSGGDPRNQFEKSWEVFEYPSNRSSNSLMHAIAEVPGGQQTIVGITPLDTLMEAVKAEGDHDVFKDVEDKFSSELMALVRNRRMLA